MGVKKYKPTSPGRRDMTVNDYAELTPQAKPEKSLLKPLKKTGGRNHHGVVTSRFRGGGNKRMYRVIDFKRNKDNVPAKVDSIQYDPNRSCHIALLHYADGEKRYILAPVGLKVGDKLESGQQVEPKVGNSMPLASMPVGYEVHNIELVSGQGGRMVRAAGGAARLIGREGKHAHIQLPSGETRMVNVHCRATVGQLGNTDHGNIKLGKAGRKRYLGRRPHVRGVAQNPVAHPLGGGEGRSGGGRHPCSPTGLLAKGGRTRKRHKASNKLIVRRRMTTRHGRLVV